MESRKVMSIDRVIDFAESRLEEKLDLDTVAAAVHYSKYHLHRMFAETAGMTLHDYVSRRRLTEGARLLIFSERPVMEIALVCGYESQQAFTSAFKAMYKMPPAEYREHGQFYPLQLRFCLQRETETADFTLKDIRPAKLSDIPAWMDLVKTTVDGYPCLEEEDYLRKLKSSVWNRQALILKRGSFAVGVMAFSDETGSIEFIGVHPQYRGRGITKIFLEKLVSEYLPHREISTTTFRENDKADTGYRKELKQLGFSERELLVEFGYPTQRFVLPVQE